MNLKDLIQDKNTLKALRSNLTLKDGILKWNTVEEFPDETIVGIMNAHYGSPILEELPRNAVIPQTIDGPMSFWNGDEYRGMDGVAKGPRTQRSVFSDPALKNWCEAQVTY